jgi:hypothetical protein
MMKIERTKEVFGTKLVVEGLIKSVEDSATFKEALNQAFIAYPNEPIAIHIKDSFIITSSIIGTLLKMIKKDNAKISMFIYQNDLFELIQKLNLVELLNAKAA